MRARLSIIVPAAVALAGCGTPVATAVVVGVMAADAARYYTIGPDGKTSIRAPSPDPSRSINVQDCTTPVDYGTGNLLCR